MASRPWARCRPKASRRSCSATSSARCAGPTIIGGRTGTAFRRGHLDRPRDQLSLRRHHPGAAPALARHRRRPALRPRIPASSSSSASSPSSTRSDATRRASSFVFDHLPGVNLYRRPADATFLVNIVLAFAAGYLVHRYVRDGLPRWSGRGLKPARSALPALAVRARRSPRSSTRHGLRGSRRTGSAALHARDRPRPSDRRGRDRASPRRGAHASRRLAAPRRGLVAFTGGELIWRHAACALNAEPAERYAVFQQLPPEQLQGLQVLKKELAERNAKGEHPRIEILGLGGAWQNASMVLGLEDTIGYNPLRLADYERAVGPGENAVDPEPAHFPGDLPRLQVPARQPARPRISRPRPADRAPAAPFPAPDRTPKLLYGSGQMWIYRLNASSPRAYVASRVTAGRFRGGAGPGGTAGVRPRGRGPRRRDAASDCSTHRFATPMTRSPARRRRTSEARIVDYQRNAVTIDVETDHAGRPRPARHLLSRLGSDGRRRAQSRCCGQISSSAASRSRPGSHRVEFEFRPTFARQSGRGGVRIS